MRILVSGAGIAGPVPAYRLTGHGFPVTVVERAPTPRRTGGHAVDLFRPAMDISERRGVLRPGLLFAGFSIGMGWPPRRGGRCPGGTEHRSTHLFSPPQAFPYSGTSDNRHVATVSARVKARPR